MKKKKFFILAAMLCLAFTSAKARVEVELDIHPRIIRIDETATANLVIRGLRNPPRPTFPSIPGLSISHAGQRTSTHLANTQLTRSTEYSYVITPTSTGEHTIGPFTYEVEGQSIELPAVTLEVVPIGDSTGKERAQQTLSDLLFAQIVVPQKTLYANQKFDFVMEIYAHERLNLTGNFDPHGIPQSRISLGQFRSMGQERRLIDGQIFAVYRFVATARAVTPGSFNVQMGMRAGVNVQDSSRDRSSGPFGDPFFESFFSRRRVENVEVHVHPLEIEILPLPAAGRPASFSGAVGVFSFDVSVQPQAVEVGDPITVTMEIRGHGNIDNVAVPELKIQDGFRVYDNRLTTSENDPNSTRARRVYECVVIPRSEEHNRIPEIVFSYFNPETGSYAVERRGPFELSVHPPDETVPPPIVADRALATREQFGEDIAYIKDLPRRLDHPKLFTTARSAYFWGFQSIPIISLALLVVFKKRRDKLRGNVALARRNRAPRVARAALKNAESAAAAGDRRRFFDALWQAAADYFGNRLNLAPGEIDASQAIAFCKAANLKREQLDQLSNLLSRCEIERFTATSSASDELDQDAREMLGLMRTILKLCERARNRGGAAAPASLVVLSIVFTIGFCTASARSTEVATAPAALFAAAGDSYDEGDFENARLKYSLLLQSGHSSPETLYNLGNAYYRMGDLGKAILNYRRAWYMSPRDPDIRANLAYALRQAQAEMPNMPLHADLFGWLNANQWLAVATILYWASAVIAGMWIFSVRHRRTLSRLIATSGMLLAISLGGIASWATIAGRAEAVVIESDQEALFAPAEGATVHFVVPKGSIVNVVDRAGEWIRVDSNDRRGWVRIDSCQAVAP